MRSRAAKKTQLIARGRRGIHLDVTPQMTADAVKFSEILRRCRLGAGLKQREVASRAGVSAAMINRIERVGERPSRTLAIALAEIFPELEPLISCSKEPWRKFKPTTDPVHKDAWPNVICIHPDARERTRVRFEDSFVPEPNTGCWLWLSMNGYGKIDVIDQYGKRRGMVAHRVAWELYRGAIPPGLAIDHLCSMKSCVNPAHLEPVTYEENARRAVERGTFRGLARITDAWAHAAEGDRRRFLELLRERGDI